MADDFSRTLNDVMSGYQGMSTTISHFGGPSATPAGSMMSSQAGYQPTPPPPIPTTTITPPPPPPPVPPFDPTTGAMSAPQPFQTATAPSGSMPNAAVSMQAGMAQAQSYNMNPMYASYMDPSMNMASAGYMTPSRAGVFRQQGVADFRSARPVGIGGQRVPDAMIPFSPGLTRHTPMQQFARGYDASMYVGQEQARLMAQGTAGYAEAAAGNLVAAGGMYAGGAIGAGIGGFIGGPGGAVLGADLGMLGGSFAQYAPGVTRATEAAFRPAIERRADAIRGQFASRQFMMGASKDLDISGQGLSTAASQRLTHDFDEMAQNTGRTRRDYLDIMQAGGEQGLMDFSQNREQIVDTVKQLSGVVGTFAEITGDPDFRNNIKKIGQLRRLGIGLNEMQQAVTNMDQYARMAGMDVDQLMQTQGMQGAGIYQGAGLAAGQGMQAGMMGGGQARQMVAGGAINARDMALYGGVSGMGQKLTEMNAAFLSSTAQPLLPYLVQEGDNGRLSINKERAEAMRRGEISYEDALREASKMEMSDGARQRIMGFRGRELTAELGEVLGPEGTQRAMVQSIMSITRDNPGIDIMTAAEMAAGPDGAAMLSRMGNQGFQQGMLRQMNQELDRRRFDARAGRGDEDGGTRLSTRLGLRNFDPIGGVQDSVSGYLADYEESKRLEAVGTTRFQRDANAAGVFEAKEATPAEISRALGQAGITGPVNQDGLGFDAYQRDFRNTYGGLTSDLSDYQRQVTGTSMFDTSMGRVDRDTAERADRMIQVNQRTTEQSAKERTQARTALQDRLGSDKYNEATKKLARKISEKNLFNVGDAELLSDEEIASTLGVSMDEFQKMDPEQIAAFQRDAANQTIDQGKGREYIKSMRTQTQRAGAAQVGEAFMRGGSGEEGVNKILNKLGFSDLGDLGEGDTGAIDALIGSADPEYLVTAALLSSGEDSVLGDSARGNADGMMKQLRKRDGDAFASKLEQAKDTFKKLPAEVKEALRDVAPSIAKKKGSRRGVDAGAVGDRLKGLEVAGGAASARQTLKGASAAADKAGIGSASTGAELISNIQGATQAERDEFREMGFGDVVDLVTSEGFKDNEEGAQQLMDVLKKKTAGQIDIKDTSGKSEAVTSQVQAIKAQQDFFNSLNVAMSTNSAEMRRNTDAVMGLTKALTGGTSNDKLNEVKGDQRQPTDTGG